MTAVRTCLSKYVDFSGRAQRSEFWWFYLFNIIGSAVANVIDTAVLGFPALSLIWMLGLILPGIAVSVRRMHDLDKSGWWIFIILIPIVGVILYIYWFVQRGTVGPNRFGPDPLAGEGTMAAA
ncbi:DUF805 domain-containing protein [[Roseibacterium] beibuensis]